MPRTWSINADWAQIESGSPEERAGFSAINITAHGTCLTEGHDRLLNSVRAAPYLSAYHLAEWLAWNWWRLRWEPKKRSPEWELSHAMASIGNGYIWPNIHILSDSQNITLVSNTTPEREGTPYRYINDAISFIPGSEFESEVDLFIDTVLCRMKDYGIHNSNLDQIWQSVTEERQDDALSQKRKLEALLGEDPGEMDEAELDQLLKDANRTGLSALEEIAANRRPEQNVPDIDLLISQTVDFGVEANSNDRVHLDAAVESSQNIPAWTVGSNAARQLRDQLNLSPQDPISNEILASLYGIQAAALESPKNPPPKLNLSLALATQNTKSLVLLRSRWETGRRFELARLLGDHLLYATNHNEPMRPATSSGTYRQKAQRAFAAELLSPFYAVDNMLEGEYDSMESQQDIAHHFSVSGLTVRTMLANHHRIDRSELDELY